MFKLNNLLYRFLWKNKGIIKKMIFVLVPLIMLFVFWYIIDVNNAYRIVLNDSGEKGYGFFDDYTNRYVAFGVFIFVYFARGIFTAYLEKKVDLFGQCIETAERLRIQHKRDIAKMHTAILSLVVSLVCIFFIYEANSKGESNWYSLIGTPGLLYYGILITYEWNLSINLFVSIMIDCFTLIGYSNRHISNIDVFHSDKCCGLKRTINSLAASLGFGLYFLAFIVMIGYSDYRAHTDFQLDMLFYQARYIIFAITIVLAVFYFTTVLFAYYRIRIKLEQFLARKKKKCKRFSEKRLFLNDINISLFSLSNLYAFVSSALIPVGSAIINVLVEH